MDGERGREEVRRQRAELENRRERKRGRQRWRAAKHEAEEMEGREEVVVESVRGEKGVEGDEVSVGHLVEHAAGVVQRVASRVKSDKVVGEEDVRKDAGDDDAGVSELSEIEVAGEGGGAEEWKPRRRGG